MDSDSFDATRCNPACLTVPQPLLSTGEAQQLVVVQRIRLQLDMLTQILRGEINACQGALVYLTYRATDRNTVVVDRLLWHLREALLHLDDTEKEAEAMFEAELVIRGKEGMDSHLLSCEHEQGTS